ncbi:hypothetical protein Q7X34_004237 [Salmonella enterica subsp. enterica]|uniref:hypothetical protein n=1 Tax=Salmonella enterica TaxID=28901 RepID=UPI0019C04901|nr:hypothetical protein [Salmonella enterica]ELH8384325.1 hypothetical protein [Salmonella enterica subsp. enterica]MDL2989061.1 hypothetical protein [Salmonella enterica]HAK6771621.1 hypothetical protein [Salmonella enterica]HAK6818159.1 hypothetical protein [Salmonella enterica]
MKIINGPIVCPYCGCLSAYYEIDRLSALRERLTDKEQRQEWAECLKHNKKRAFCLMCHHTIEIPAAHAEE